MSSSASLVLAPGVEAVFVPGRPARTGRLALWQPGRTPEAFTDTIDVIVPAGDTVRQRTVPATLLPLWDVLDELVGLGPDAPCGPSVHGWAAAARGALHLIARGRLLPAVDEEGVDSWRLGPLDPDDLAARDKLVHERKSLKDLILEMEDEVLANAGVDVFEELFKLIFTKLYDELEGGRDKKRHLVFKNYGETETELRDKIQGLFDKARGRWEGVFSTDAKLELTPSHLAALRANTKASAAGQ